MRTLRRHQSGRVLQQRMQSNNFSITVEFPSENCGTTSFPSLRSSSAHSIGTRSRPIRSGASPLLHRTTPNITITLLVQLQCQPVPSPHWWSKGASAYFNAAWCLQYYISKVKLQVVSQGPTLPPFAAHCLAQQCYL